MKSSKIILLPFIVCILLFSLPMKAIDMCSSWHSTTVMQDACDSLFIIDGRGYAVKNVTMTAKYVTFSVCDSTTDKVRKVPWAQVQFVKKMDGSIITAENTRLNSTPEEQLEREVRNLLFFTIITLCLGIGIFAGTGILIMVSKYRKKILGHPKEKQLGKMLKWTKTLAILTFPLFLFFILSAFIGTAPIFRLLSILIWSIITG